MSIFSSPSLPLRKREMRNKRGLARRRIPFRKKREKGYTSSRSGRFLLPSNNGIVISEEMFVNSSTTFILAFCPFYKDGEGGQKVIFIFSLVDCSHDKVSRTQMCVTTKRRNLDGEKKKRARKAQS